MTSFQKKSSNKVRQIPGARPSLYNNQFLISSGIPSLDYIIGGGIAVGTVLLVEEDRYGNYAKLMLKYFCAESVMTGHSLILTSADCDPRQLLKELPAPIFDDPHKDIPESNKHDSEQMKIAWRYKHLPKFQCGPSGIKFGHYYDLSQTMEDDLVKTIETTICEIDNGPNMANMTCSNNQHYARILKKIQVTIENGGFNTAVSSEKRNILRIAIHSIGSPLWNENGVINENYDNSLPRFLLSLRAVLRSAYAVCMITAPTHLFYDRVFLKRIERLCDTVVEVNSFIGSDKEKNQLYKEYHGLFKIKQLPSLNSLISHVPDSFDLAFKLRRKKFTIEKLHLPPDLSATANRSQNDPILNDSSQSTGNCVNRANGSKLDF